MANQTKSCACCGFAASFRPITAEEKEIDCPRCGRYRLTGSAEATLRATPIKNPGAVSGWIRRQNTLGITHRIDSDNLDHLRALTKPPLRERVEQYLLAVVAKAPTLEQPVIAADDDLVGASYSDHVNELAVIIPYLEDQG